MKKIDLLKKGNFKTNLTPVDRRAKKNFTQQELTSEKRRKRRRRKDEGKLADD